MPSQHQVDHNLRRCTAWVLLALYALPVAGYFVSRLWH